MRVLSSFLAIGTGFLTIAILVATMTILLRRVAPAMVEEQLQPSRLHLWLNLMLSAICAATGGYITAWIAQVNPLIHTLVLALVVLLMCALTMLQMKGRQQPLLYQIALTALTPLAVLGGGLLRLNQLALPF